jgi:hypothetical protein
MSSLQTQIEERGARIFDLVDRYPESIFSKAGFYQRMMALSMRDEHFQSANAFGADSDIASDSIRFDGGSDRSHV